MSEDRQVGLLDIGGTKTRFALAKESSPGPLTLLRTEPTPYAYAEFLSALKRVRKLVDVQLSVVGVSFGVGLSGGIVQAASKMPDFVGRNLAVDIGAIFGAPTIVHHDCVCVLASLAADIQEDESFSYVTVSTGLGAALVSRMGGMMYFQRIRLAHHVIDQNSPERCTCGRFGCLATFVDSARFKQSGLDLERVSDPGFWRNYVGSLAVGLGNLCRMFGLSRLFLGGGVVRNPNVRQSLVAAIYAQIPDDGYQRPTVEVAVDEDLAPLRGAWAATKLVDAKYREF